MGPKVEFGRETERRGLTLAQGCSTCICHPLLVDYKAHMAEPDHSGFFAVYILPVWAKGGHGGESRAKVAVFNGVNSRERRLCP